MITAIIRHTLAATALCVAAQAGAQAMYFTSASRPDIPAPAAAQRPDSVRTIEELDAFLAAADTMDYRQLTVTRPLPPTFFTPPVYHSYIWADTTAVFTPDYSGEPAMQWVEEENALARREQNMRRALFFTHPELVRYNINMLPEAPKIYHAEVNPEDHTIEIKELLPELPDAPTVAALEVKRKHWINKFNASLQFSQAYISPNWYQGGNNNLNMLGMLYYNVKLNQEYHPNLLFETTVQYKLGVNNAPDDKIHDYNISDDLFQFTSTFGLKAAKRWYYSLSANFKTQFLNSYPSNSTELRSAFLSPGELTVGLGMTYNYANAKKTFTFDASMAPVSYNLRTCTSNRIDHTLYNVEPDRKTNHNFGSSTELKLFWKISYNISFQSRIFAFTDYTSGQADWENTLKFDINRFLTTQIFCHLRYDSKTPRTDDLHWKKLQVKEILSIGFSYNFSSI